MNKGNDFHFNVASLCHKNTLIAHFCLSVFFIATASLSHASGFSVPGGLSVAGLGTADTLVANPIEVGAFPYNPAAMSFHEGKKFMLGLTAVWPNSGVTPEGESNKTSDDPDSPIFVPNLYLMNPITDKWTFGLAVNAPFGLETNWQEGTFPAFSGALAPFEPTKSSLEMFNLNPNISYQFNERASFSGGISYYRVLDATSDTQSIHLSGDGYGLGWNVASMYVLKQWSFGASYQSTVKADLNGEFDATRVFGFKANTKSELEFPDILRLGVRYQVNEKLAIEFDFDRTGWSTFDEIVVKSRDDIPEVGISSGNVLVKATNNWRNTNSYHIGSTYQFKPTFQLRFGYTLNENPQPEVNFTPQYPNSRRHLFTAGFKRENKNWDIEGGIMYARWENRMINNSKPFTGGDANGTTVYNGKYKLDGILVGIGVNFHF